MLFYKIIIWIAVGSVVVPIILSLSKVKGKSVVFSWLTLLLIFSFSADLLSFVFRKHSFVITNIYSTSEFLIITVLLFYGIGIGKKFQYLLVVAILFLSYVLIDFILIHSISERNTNIYLVQAFWFIPLSIAFYVRLIDTPPVTEIRTYPMFWIVTGIISYFAGNLFLYAANLIVENKNLYQLYIPIHSFFMIAKNSFFAYGIYLENKRIRAL